MTPESSQSGKAAVHKVPDLDTGTDLQDFEANFQVYHDLMQNRISEILLVLTPYDAFILEEDGSFASRVINQYHGLNLSQPPRMSRAASGREAIDLVRGRHFDLVITLPQVEDMDGFTLGRMIKAEQPDLPVILLVHQLRDVLPLAAAADRGGIDDVYVWNHDPDLLLALIKSVEDCQNADHDTARAMVRVLLLVEDSPHYRSFFLPLIFREVMAQTQAVLDESLTDEHRLLKMRARPKILVANNYEAALEICRTYRTYLHGVISDTSFPRKGEEDPQAGLRLLRKLRRDHPDLPLLLLSTEAGHRQEARRIPAAFAAKEEGGLELEVHEFFLHQLGFGDFVFRSSGGEILGRASNLFRFERMIEEIPADSLLFHAQRNHFSNWIMARSEVTVASKLREQQVGNFPDSEALREYLVACIRSLRRHRQQGVAIPFPREDFDAEIMDFLTIGDGIMGGKALGLAFISRYLRETAGQGWSDRLKVFVPRTYVITTSGFDEFVEAHGLRRFRAGGDDAEIAAAFRGAPLPAWLVETLRRLLDQVRFPLSVRSSSIMEDARFRPFAGLYSTYMIPNNHPDPEVRLAQLLDAVRLVYASAYFRGPRAFARTVQQEGKDGMGVLIQELVGRVRDDYFYPALSGVAMSRNYYPVPPMKPEEGVVQLALGFGKTVVEGGRCLRFSPHHPQALPQFSTVEETLANSQRRFYALKMSGGAEEIRMADDNLVSRPLDEAADEAPLVHLTSGYLAEEGRIRDGQGGGVRLLTFANLLKYDRTLATWLVELLALGRRGMGGEVEIEFAAELDRDGKLEALYFLQIRPLAGGSELFEVEISPAETAEAFCSSSEALGHGVTRGISDIVYTRPESFDVAHSLEIAREIGRLNLRLQEEERPYLLVGYGRWGSLDHWLGVPVTWADISGVRAMIELRGPRFAADSSQGTHFFHNITSLGIPYLTVNEERDRFDWDWLERQPALAETEFLRHVRLEKPLVVKVDGRESRGVIYQDKEKESRR